MKMYVATFHGDIEGKPPIAAHSLDEVLRLVQKRDKYGLVQNRGTFYNDKGRKQVYVEYYTPDPEDDKIEIWEYDTETNSGHVVWGFWGWHWQMPNGLEQGTMPGNDEPLYVLAMRDY